MDKRVRPFYSKGGSMAGFTIHLAVAKQYNKKHPQQIKNMNEFFKGTLAPDLNKK